MEALENYYKERYYPIMRVEFKDLKPEFKASLENSLGFAGYRLNEAFVEFATAFTKPFFKLFSKK